jgi:hypothetical protein
MQADCFRNSLLQSTLGSIGKQKKRAGICSALVSKGIPSWFLLLGSFNAFSFGCSCDARIDDHLMDGVPALGNDDLQVQVRHAWDQERFGSRAVLVYRVTTDPGAPAWREGTVAGHSVDLSTLPLPSTLCRAMP